MFEELKKRTLKGTLVWSIILILAGLGLAGWNAMDAFTVVTGCKDFTTLDPDEIKNQVVKFEMAENFGCYLEAYSENTKTHARRTTDLYYVIWTGTPDTPIEDVRYMSIKVPPKFESELERMAENTYEGVVSTPLTMYGKIKKLDSSELYYFEDFFKSLGFTEDDIAAETLPYYIDYMVQPATMLYVVLFVAGVVLLIYGIARIARAASGSALKKLHKDIADAGYTEASIESDYRNAKSFDKKGTLKVGKLMTYYTNGSIPRAIPNSKMMWAYQNTVTHRTNGVKTGTTYNVMVYDEITPKGHTFAMANEAVAKDMLNYLYATLPWIVVGYSDELKKLYNKDRAQFLQLRYNTCEHTAVDPAANAPQENAPTDSQA